VRSVIATEPVLAHAGAAAAVNAGQAPISLPVWVHILIVVASIVLASLNARRHVTPTGP
jgi:uncharacterized protein (DUF983 family)